ncbi:hypothetical protein [Amycolatopsis taiwanensis]|uniref:ESAT-6-like protein n=1 Tax=Amycolatopsis taiwanensis TaxID=342230 RepID=A0A9W6VIF9_9PSEU|nr:hypothetical protein [Amycolatopsis taiwanensis]GLY68394.1 hypothetical protein Atai01_50130 [Amycolatopsis taiwanensis]
MSDGFEVDADRLAARAKDFDGLVASAGEIAAELDRALTDAESAWGDDVVGRNFAAAHAGPARDSAEVVRNLAGSLREVGDAFGEAARRHRAGDSAAAESIDRAAGG